MELKSAEGTYVELAAELAVGAELDVDTLVEAETYQVQRLLHCDLFFTRHLSAPSVLALQPDVKLEAEESLCL